MKSPKSEGRGSRTLSQFCVRKCTSGSDVCCRLPIRASCLCWTNKKSKRKCVSKRGKKKKHKTGGFSPNVKCGHRKWALQYELSEQVNERNRAEWSEWIMNSVCVCVYVGKARKKKKTGTGGETKQAQISTQKQAARNSRRKGRRLWWRWMDAINRRKFFELRDETEKWSAQRKTDLEITVNKVR